MRRKRKHLGLVRFRLLSLSLCKETPAVSNRSGTRAIRAHTFTYQPISIDQGDKPGTLTNFPRLLYSLERVEKTVISKMSCSMADAMRNTHGE